MELRALENRSWAAGRTAGKKTKSDEISACQAQTFNIREHCALDR